MSMRKTTLAPGQLLRFVHMEKIVTMHRGKVDPGASELPRGNELSRDHVNRPLESGRSVERKVHFFGIPWDNQNFHQSQTFCLYYCAGRNCLNGNNETSQLITNLPPDLSITSPIC